MIIDLEQYKEKLVGLDKKIALLKDQDRASELYGCLVSLVGAAWLHVANLSLRANTVVKIKNGLDRLENVVNDALGIR